MGLMFSAGLCSWDFGLVADLSPFMEVFLVLMLVSLCWAFGLGLKAPVFAQILGFLTLGLLCLGIWLYLGPSVWLVPSLGCWAPYWA